MRSNLQKVLSALVSTVLLLCVMMPPVHARAAGEVSAPGENAPSESTPESSEPTESTPTETPEAHSESSSEPSHVPAESSAPHESTSSASDAESSAPSEPPEERSAASTSPSTLPAESTAPTETAEEEPPDLDWNLYFGQLHAHSNSSDGHGSVTEAFTYAAQVKNLDFFALTDHSDSFDNDESGSIDRDGAAVSAEWAAGKAAAAAVTDETFVGIFGYEMSWQEDRQLGHLNTFATPGFLSRDQEEFTHSLEKYYQALTTVPGSVSQFNHPGSQYGDFERFGHYSAAYDAQICLLEVGTEEGFTGSRAYTRALDAGWHVAPTTSQNNHNGSWGDAREDRTVILAGELTEESLYDAMRERRVYATADGDLTVYYQLDGHIMGSILGDRDHPEITVYLSDPTDEEIGLVEVIVDGGQVAASDRLDESEGTLTLHPRGGYSYYYLRITQPDGDVALTAPVWTDSFEDMGIAEFTADTQPPTSGRELHLSLALYNDENTDCRIQCLEFFADGALIHSADTAGALNPRDYYEYSFPYTHPGLGTVDFQVRVTGSAAGRPRQWSETLTLQFLPEELVTGILVDGGHGSAAPDHLKNFTALASDARMQVTVFDGDLPAGGTILLIFAPERDFEEAFLSQAAAFAESGGSIILCGRAGDPSGSSQLNRLLKVLGSTMRLRGDTAADERNPGESPDRLYSTVYNEASPWCARLNGAPFYTHLGGCTLDPGRGTWLVRGESDDGEVLLACEDTAWGGQIFAAGSPFLCDDAMPLPKNKWDQPKAGQRVAEQLMDTREIRPDPVSIRELRQGQPGQIYRIRGYVTAGTSNSHTRFPETLYLQDDTDGIAVVPFREKGIQVGTPMDVTGYLEIQNGIPVLKLLDFDLPDKSFHRHVPKTVRCKTAMDYAQNGGKLMQVEGRAVSVTLTEDQKGVARLTVRDYLDEDAEILIEPCIGSGAGGGNRLAAEIREGRLVRAMGILHLDENGKPVLRVRNCDEVVYIPPRRLIPGDNPKTGDPGGILAAVSVISLVGAAMVTKKRRSM